MKKLLLFDIDGTLLRAEDATRHAINESFRELFSLDEKIKNLNDLSFFAWTDLGLFKQAALTLIGRELDAKEYAAFTAKYTERLRGHLKTCKFYLMPGIAELLPRLSARKDIVLGVETGNIEPAAHLKLERGGIEGFFRCGGFGSDNADRSELIQAGIQRARSLDHTVIAEENIYIIGDSTNDIEAGNKLGLKTIAVGTGLTDQSKILAACPTAYFKDLTDISALLGFIGASE